MRFLVSILAAAACALAQTAPILSPTTGTTLTRGTATTIRVSRPPYIQSENEAVLVLGLQHCVSSTFCDDPSTILGTSILYKGPFTPTLHTDGTYQDFTVTVPSDFPTGTAQIGTARLVLLGVSNAPYHDYQKVQVNIV